MSILLLNVNQERLNKGQCLYVSKEKVKQPRKVEELVFVEKGEAYGMAKLFGVSREKCELLKIYTPEELGLVEGKTHRLSKNGGTKATWINWDYPMFFDKPVPLDKFRGFRLANDDEKDTLREQILWCRSMS